jgi:hypothetical protein
VEVIRQFTTVDIGDAFGPVSLKLELKFYLSDPLAVNLIFENPDGSEVEWQVSRELLKSGLGGQVGQGDVSFWPSDSSKNSMSMYFDTEGQSAHMTVASEVVREFLQRTEELLPLGAEEDLVFAGFDDWLEDHL